MTEHYESDLAQRFLVDSFRQSERHTLHEGWQRALVTRVEHLREREAGQPLTRLDRVDQVEEVAIDFDTERGERLSIRGRQSCELSSRVARR